MLATAITTLDMNSTHISQLKSATMNIKSLSIETLYVELLPKFWLSASIIMLCLCMSIWLVILCIKVALLIKQIRDKRKNRLLDNVDRE